MNPAAAPVLKPNDFLDFTLGSTDFAWLGQRTKGKVRDVYDRGSELVLIASDRQSAYDISWCEIPLKGQVLNQISNWWFKQTAEIVPNHLIASPDPNVAITKKLKMFPVEVVVRAYLTGTTETSIWVNYNRGVRNYCGNALPDGMKQHQALPDVIITPTTKGEKDELIDAGQVVSRGLATEQQWADISVAALRLFREGQRLAAERNLILVDTKYEFGIDADGTIRVGDEVHTPDSSRFWMADSYESRMADRLNPESLDKDFFRRWLKENGFNPEKEKASFRPDITDEVRAALSQKYLDLFQLVTGERFVFPAAEPASTRIERNLQNYYS